MPTPRVKRAVGVLGVSLVALALTAAGPLWAAEKADSKAHKEAPQDAGKKDSGKSDVTKGASKSAKGKSDAKTDDSGDDAKPTKGKTKLAEADSQKTSGKSAKASDDDDAPVKGKTSKLADKDDDDKTSKAGSVKGGKSKTTKLAAKDDSRDDDSDAKPVKSGTKAEKAKTSKLAAKASDKDDDDAKPVKAGKGKTSRLADADDSDSKTAKSSKAKSKLADKDGDDDDSKAAKAAKGKSSKLAAKDDDDDKPTKASKAKSAKLADADDTDTKTVKTSKSKTTRLADADDDTTSAKTKADASADDGSDDVKTTKVSLSGKDAASDRFLRTRLAQVKSQLAEADCKTVTKAAKGHSRRHKAKTVRVCKVDHEDVALVEALTKANTTLELAAAHPKPLSSLNVASGPQPYSPSAPSTTAPVVAVSAPSGPVPYLKVQAEAANTSGVLSPADAQLYQTAFSQVDHSDFDDAEASLAQVSDRSLVGYVEYRKLMNTRYSASYDELVAWLGQYGDQPTAMRVWNIAKRKKPAGAPDPAYPSLSGQPAPQAVAQAASADSVAVPLSAMTTLAPNPVKAEFNPGAPQLDTADSDLTPKSARSAYNNGQLEMAVTLAHKIGDHWVAGLADWRLKRYDQALTEFKFVSTDPSRNAWSQSSGAYWAARCALKLNDASTADSYFKVAASFPYTFYGLLAEARLGVTPAVALAKKGLPPTFQASARAQVAAATTTDDFAWAQTDNQAHRMNALLQVGRTSDAAGEAKAAIQSASDDATRDRWTALAAHNHIGVNQLIVTDQLFDAALYPIPAYTLKGQGGVDRALVFAFARKESKFNATAKSYAGAYGLLQLMPGTAALVENNQSFNAKPSQLLKPTVNLRVGQKYIQRLMDSKIVGGDLLRTIAAYNSGPGPVKDAVTTLGDDADSLLVMESIPVAQTREYVEEVAANYWIYRQLMGKQTPSLTQAASDARIIDTTADADRTDVALADDADAQ